MSQRNKLQVLKDRLGISNAISVQPATLAEYSLNNCHQTIAASIHKSPLLQWKEVGPHIYRRSSYVDNLQKIGLTFMLNTTSLQQFHISQTKAQTSTQSWAFVCLSIPLRPHTMWVRLNMKSGMYKYNPLSNSIVKNNTLPNLLPKLAWRKVK
jgi:hypothetical protein